MQAMDSEAKETMPRKTLAFFAPEHSNRTVLDAYDLYLHHLDHSGRFDITIMAPNGSIFAQKAREQGFTLHPVSDFARKLLLRTPQLWPILTATRRYRFDIALSHQAFACRGLNMIARTVIGVCHDDQFDGFEAAHRVIALTSGAADLAQNLLEDKVTVDILPYPYRCQFDDIVPLPTDKDGALTIGASGSFEEGDGLGAFIHAAQLLHQSCPQARFVIAGEGPLEHDLKELADQIAPFIDFVGPLTPEELAEQIDIYCLTAPNVPYSLPLCEMMDAGIACVSTCTHGPMDILKGGMVAPLVPIGDAFLLAVQLQELLEDRAFVERIKKSCFERIREEDFQPDLFEKRLLDLCNSA
ncbi:glycosyltransferase [Cohaesibacter celericrescens]|uniref:Glycosyl transferase family 1 domain-containing protein n=1 Tax=Cohaesibacter celericrescens TaxID=2067669 RepID=A0A2N5XR48_9HYPH|nr:glycosyltransferase [Cohaesibacter celericrescens]PLW76996.1 hypothetical protein C0081_13205 [Cohaesibacter celericrescens]